MGFNDIVDSVRGGATNLFQGKRSSSEPVQLPNLYTPEQGREFGDKAASMATSMIPADVMSVLLDSVKRSPATVTPIASGPNPFMDILLSIVNGKTGMSDAERNLVANLQSTVSGRYNALGIGDSGKATTEIAAAAAPALVEFQKNRADQAIRGGTLSEAERAAKTGEALSAEQINTARSKIMDENLINVFNALLKSGAISIQSLLELARLGAPQFGELAQGGLPSAASGIKDITEAGANIGAMSGGG